MLCGLLMKSLFQRATIKYVSGNKLAPIFQVVVYFTQKTPILASSVNTKNALTPPSNSSPMMAHDGAQTRACLNYHLLSTIKCHLNGALERLALWLFAEISVYFGLSKRAPFRPSVQENKSGKIKDLAVLTSPATCSVL